MAHASFFVAHTLVRTFYLCAAFDWQWAAAPESATAPGLIYDLGLQGADVPGNSAVHFTGYSGTLAHA